MTKVSAHIIFGSNPEPFLEAALRAVEWVDYYCAINTDPESSIAAQNEATFRRVVPREKQRLERIWMKEMDFARARNECLKLATTGDYVLLVDADDVHYPEFEGLAREFIERGHDMITTHFWHLIGYKDLWGQEPHREILFTKTDETGFLKNVHEGLSHPRQSPGLVGDYHYVHYGYIKPPREIFRRWVLYSKLEGDPEHYAGRDPDEALAGWFESTQPFWREHPPAVQEVLKGYPSAPASLRAIEAPCNVGLVLLTWNDAENLETCLKTLATTRQPFKLMVVDNGSTDNSMDLCLGAGNGNEGLHTTAPELSLAQALNVGFQHFMDDPDVDYIGWIHPDMVFERDTWLECLRNALDTHADIVKVGAWELGTVPIQEPVPGNSQCYLVRKSALEQVGLFDERFEACGGYEDWEHNARLLEVGRVVIWPDAIVRHNAMGTRQNHDNVEAAKRNAELYHSIVGQWEAVV